MSFYPSQVVQQAQKVQFQGANPFGRIIGQPPVQIVGGPTAYQSGINSPMMRSNLSVFSQPPQHRQQSSQDLGQYLRQPQVIQKTIDQQNQQIIQNGQKKQHYIQPHYNPGQNSQIQIKQNNNSQSGNSLQVHQQQKIQRQTSFHQQPLQSSKLTLQSLPANNTNSTLPVQSQATDRTLNFNLSPQPQQRLNSLLSSPIQRAVSPQSSRGVTFNGNPYIVGGQTIYSPAGRVQSQAFPGAQGLIFNGRNSFSGQPQSFYQNNQHIYSKANSLPLQQQHQVLPYKLELPQKIQDNQQKMNEAIAKSEKIKKLVAEKQQQMKVHEQKRQELLEVSKIHVLTPQISAQKIKKQQSPLKNDESPIKTIQQQIQNVINAQKATTTNNHPINSIVNSENDLIPIGAAVSFNNLEQNKEKQQNVNNFYYKTEESDCTLNQINQNQEEFKKLQQEFKQAANKIKEITKPSLLHTPISLLTKADVKFDKQPYENKENFQMVSTTQPQTSGDITTGGEIKSEFKSTINQFRKSFSKNMYQTPVNIKKKFKKKIYDNEDEYQGGIENEIPNGYGILKDKTGKEIYKGDWKNGQYDGSGILINKNTQSDGQKIDHQDLSQIFQQNLWVKYEGDMKSNEIKGFGTIYFNDNMKIVGNFDKGIPEGQGSFYSTDGKVIAAVWENGKLVEVLWD